MISWHAWARSAAHLKALEALGWRRAKCRLTRHSGWAVLMDWKKPRKTEPPFVEAT